MSKLLMAFAFFVLQPESATSRITFDNLDVLKGDIVYGESETRNNQTRVFQARSLVDDFYFRPERNSEASIRCDYFNEWNDRPSKANVPIKILPGESHKEVFVLAPWYVLNSIGDFAGFVSGTSSSRWPDAKDYLWQVEPSVPNSVPSRNTTQNSSTGLPLNIRPTNEYGSNPSINTFHIGRPVNILSAPPIYGSSGNRRVPRIPVEPPKINIREVDWGRVDRMSPVTFSFFEVPLKPEFNDPEKLEGLRQKLEPSSRLYTLLSLIRLANQWVEVLDGSPRVSLEQQMLDYVNRNAAGPAERQYLIQRIKLLVATKEFEQGNYMPK